MMQDRFCNGCQVTPVAVRSRVADIPELSCKKLINCYTVLDQTLVTEEGVSRIAKGNSALDPCMRARLHHSILTDRAEASECH
jgi:hypothetical protein